MTPTLLQHPIDTAPTALGPMTVLLAVDTDGSGRIVLLEYADNPHLEREQHAIEQALDLRTAPGNHPLFGELQKQLTAYLQGQRTTFDLPLQPIGTTFQQESWAALLQIPYGQTCSYTQQALRMSRTPRAVRAVAGANGRNRLPILIPCHRVIGANGSLTGYSGGLQRKKILLEIEARNPRP